jgi:hypothetical protein
MPSAGIKKGDGAAPRRNGSPAIPPRLNLSGSKKEVGSKAVAKEGVESFVPMRPVTPMEPSSGFSLSSSDEEMKPHEIKEDVSDVDIVVVGLNDIG